MITPLRNPNHLGLVQPGQDRAEEEGDEEARNEKRGGEPEDGFAEARGDFAGFGILRIASRRAQAWADVIGIDKTRGNQDSGRGKGPRFVPQK